MLPNSRVGQGNLEARTGMQGPRKWDFPRLTFIQKDPSGFTEAQDLVRRLQRISLSLEQFVLPDIKRRKTHGPLCLETDVLHDIFRCQPTSILGFAFSRGEVWSWNSFCECFPLTSEVFRIGFGKGTSWDVQNA